MLTINLHFSYSYKFSIHQTRRNSFFNFRRNNHNIKRFRDKIKTRLQNQKNNNKRNNQCKKCNESNIVNLTDNIRSFLTIDWLHNLNFSWNVTLKAWLNRRLIYSYSSFGVASIWYLQRRINFIFISFFRFIILICELFRIRFRTAFSTCCRHLFLHLGIIAIAFFWHHFIWIHFVFFRFFL